MANIRVDSPNIIGNGSKIVFIAPVDSYEISGLSVYYKNKNEQEEFKSFVFKDAHGEPLVKLGNLFKEGAFVYTILDVDNGYAYIQNPDTNSYLEGRFDDINKSILDTLSDVKTNTKAKMIAGALAFKEFVSEVAKQIGSLSQLSTDTKNNVVEALNEVNASAKSALEKFAKYLPITTDGNVNLETGEEKGIEYLVANPNRRISLAILPDGTYGVRDQTNNKWLWYSEIDGNVNVPSKLTADSMFVGTSKVLTAEDFIITGSADEATLTINLDPTIATIELPIAEEASF